MRRLTNSLEIKLNLSSNPSWLSSMNQQISPNLRNYWTSHRPPKKSMSLRKIAAMKKLIEVYKSLRRKLMNAICTMKASAMNLKSQLKIKKRRNKNKKESTLNHAIEIIWEQSSLTLESKRKVHNSWPLKLRFLSQQKLKNRKWLWK